VYLHIKIEVRAVIAAPGTTKPGPYELIRHYTRGQQSARINRVDGSKKAFPFTLHIVIDRDSIE
jgi:hypothetical protein